MKNYFLIYLSILLSYNLTAMDNIDSNNTNNYQDYILNNNFINNIQKYLKGGGNINYVNCNGDNLLILAVKKNDLQAIKFLLDNNALVSLLNNNMRTALDYAKENGNPQIIELLQQKHNQELDLLNLNSININFNTLETDFNMLEQETLLEENNSFKNLINIDNNNLNSSNNLDKIFFDNMSDIDINALYEFFNNLQNIQSQTKDQNIDPLAPQPNTNQLKTKLANQEQNNKTKIENNSNRIWQCNLCNKAFTAKSNLKQHKEGVHALTKDFKCNKCKKAFTSNRYLKQHKKEIHALTKDFKCNICNYKTSIKSALKRHIDSKHTKKINYTCNYKDCKFKTSWITSLTRHKKIKSH